MVSAIRTTGLSDLMLCALSDWGFSRSYKCLVMGKREGENHLQCLNERAYCDSCATEEESLICFYTISGGGQQDVSAEEHAILFIKEGSVDIEWRDVLHKGFREGMLLLVPSGSVLCLFPERDTVVMSCRFPRDFRFCELFHLEYQEEKRQADKLTTLEAHDLFTRFVENIEYGMGLGIHCRRYTEMKMSEMLYMFQFLYNEEELYSFFSPVLSRDLEFKQFVLENWDQVDSIEELAGKANYHRDTFTRKFQRVMGETPRQWMKKKRAELIIRELRFGSKPLKEIAEMFKFSSPAAFSTFCKKEFNDTPARIRRGDLDRRADTN